MTHYSQPAPLQYERRPVGRLLIDEDAGAVSVRIFPHAGRPWGVISFMGLFGLAAGVMAIHAARSGAGGEAIGMAICSVFILLLVGGATFAPTVDPVTILATPEALTYRHPMFGEALIP